MSDGALFGHSRYFDLDAWFATLPFLIVSKAAKSEKGRGNKHPTVKPIGMVADAILDVTRRGDIVLDPFLGSGTTLMACERTGRRCRGLELDPLYVDVIVRRWQAYAGAEARLAETGQSFDAVAMGRTSNGDQTGAAA